MILHIKNMNSLRCKLVVEDILDQLQISYSEVEMGRIILSRAIGISEIKNLKQQLAQHGLHLVEGNKEILVEKIKHGIGQLIHEDAASCALKTSHYLSDKLNYNYTYLANVFSQETGICLSDYIIANKIEKAKEMLTNQGLTVSEIAWKLNYSSVAHLSNQFIKVTGQRPSKYKKKYSKPIMLMEPATMMEAV